MEVHQCWHLWWWILAFLYHSTNLTTHVAYAITCAVVLQDTSLKVDLRLMAMCGLGVGRLKWGMVPPNKNHHVTCLGPIIQVHTRIGILTITYNERVVASWLEGKQYGYSAFKASHCQHLWPMYETQVSCGTRLVRKRHISHARLSEETKEYR